MNRQQVIDTIAVSHADLDGDYPIDASDLLLNVMPDAEKKFRKLDKALIAYLKEVRKHFPDAQYYTASGGFNLLLGAAHDPRTEKARYELSCFTGNAEIGDGDW